MDDVSPNHQPHAHGFDAAREQAAPALLCCRLEVGLGQLGLGFYSLAPAVACFFLLAERLPHVPEVE